MRIQSLLFLGLIALTAVSLHSQPTNGPVYWSSTPPDCSSLSGESAVAITNSSGATVGYSCYVSGTFVWFAAGGGWGTTIRLAAPASAPVGVDYSFYDTAGKDLGVDTRFGSSTSTASGSDVNFALAANQASEVTLLGATSNQPNYGSTSTGSVYAVFYCPDAGTCSNVLPQLLYSALPTNPWAISVPIAWDTLVWTQWSAVGIDDGGIRRVSFVVYNEDVTATTFTVRVYDSAGNLVGKGTTPSIPPLQTLPNGYLGEGGTYGALLSDVISTKLPSGVFKVHIDGGTKYSAVEVLQFNGQSATSLQVAYDTAPPAGSASAIAPGPRPDIRSGRAAARAKGVFPALATQ